MVGFLSIFSLTRIVNSEFISGKGVVYLREQSIGSRDLSIGLTEGKEFEAEKRRKLKHIS